MTQPTMPRYEGSNSPKDQASIPPGPPHHVTILHMHAIYSQAQNNATAHRASDVIHLTVHIPHYNYMRKTSKM